MNRFTLVVLQVLLSAISAFAEEPTRWVLIVDNSTNYQPCVKIVNANGNTIDTSCPGGPPDYGVGTLYMSDNQGDWAGGRRHNCTWPGSAYAYVNSIDPDGTCHVMAENSKNNFGTDFHGVCLGTYYVTQNITYKNVANVGWGPGSGFACNKKGDNCFKAPGANSTLCQEDEEGSCFADINSNCHVSITQGEGSSVVACPTAGTGN